MQYYSYILLITLLDIIGLACAKQWYVSHNKFYIIIGSLCFAFIPFVFSFTSKYASSGVANAAWAGLTTALVTISGIVIFKELISTWQIIGILIIILGLFLMEIK